MSVYETYLAQKNAKPTLAISTEPVSTTPSVYQQYLASKKAPAPVQPTFGQRLGEEAKSNVVQNFPGTIQGLAELQIDPLSLKANPDRALLDAFNGIKDPLMQEGQNINDLFHSKSLSQGVGNSAKVLAGGASVILSPITALFNAANDIPVLGSVSKLISTAFTYAGESAKTVSDAVVDKLPISQQAKDDIKPGLGEVAALATQLLAGKAVDIGVKKVELARKYGTQDAQTIIDKATEIAKQKQAVPAPPTPSSETPIYNKYLKEQGFKVPEVQPTPEVKLVETPQTVGTPSETPISKDLQPLAQEAKDTITLYRAAPKFPSDKFDKGTYFADTEQAARYYSESHYKGQPQDIKVQQFTLPKDAVFKEPSTGNYILKGEAPVKISTPETSLITEARKYKSAEEFVKAQNVSRTEMAQENIDVMKQNGFDHVINEDGTFTLYHKTNLTGANGIERSGFRENSFFADSPESADALASTNKKGNTKTIEVKVDPADIFYNSGTNEFEASAPLVKGRDGIYREKGLQNPSQLTDFYNKAVKSMPKETVPTENIKPSKIGLNIQAKAIEEGLTKGFKDTAGYSPTTVKAQAEQIANLMNSDFETAKRIVKGDEPIPQGMSGSYLIKAMEDRALETGDIKLIRDLAKSPLTSETSVHAQELRLAGEREQGSPVATIQEIMKARAEKVNAKIKDIVKAKADIVKEIKSEIKKTAPSKQTWSDFIKSIQC